MVVCLERDTSQTPILVPAYELLSDKLRDQIISGELPAGTKLTIAMVASRYGVSQMPVREAFQRLCGEGLITLHPHRGATVRSIDAAFVQSIYDLRGAIEALLGRLGAPHLMPEDLDRLQVVHADITQAVAANDIKRIVELNNQFHHLIYRHSGNTEALRLFEQYSALVGSLRSRFGFGAGRLQTIILQHASILGALRAHDVPLLEHLLRAHCEGAKADLLARLNEARPEAEKEVTNISDEQT